jgi:hypothetical protein
MRHLTIIIIIILSLSISSNSFAWSLKTHLWISQQVLNDVVDDGNVTMLGKYYRVPAHIVNALRLHPDKFRMGSLGPDVFPDPIVGQTTTHPGVINGWQTDEWLKYLLANAKTPEEIAFTYGFVIHACSDIFAHTYVNAYAGDIFELTDGERDVELRHFILEKYIESLTPNPKDNSGNPVDWNSVLGVPAEYLRNLLILNGDVFEQYLKAKTGLHLSSMHAVKQTVTVLNKTTNDVKQEFTKWAAEYYKLQLDYYTNLAQAKISLKAAETTLDAQEELLKVKRKAYDAALGALAEANNIVQKHPELIAFQENLLAEQIKVAADLAEESVNVAARVSNEISNLRSKISDLRGEIVSLACHLLVYPPAVKKCKDKVKDANRAISRIENQISGLEAQKEAAKKAAENADRVRDDIKQTVDKLKNEYNNAVKGIAEKTYEAAVLAAETELKVQELAVEKAKEAIEKAKEVVETIQNEIDKIDPIIDEIKKAADKYNIITVLLDNWLKGIDKASTEYILASHRAGLKMINNSGNPKDEYTEWYKCYGFVFAAVPIQVTEAGCFVTDEVSKLKSKYDELIASLPEILQWVINPTKKASDLVLEKAKPELEKAAFNITSFITDPGTADFMFLLMKPENASLSKLINAYNHDNTQKRLLTFADVSKLVLQDLSVENEVLNTTKFGPLINSVTLSKLAVLNPTSLNEIIKDQVGEYSSPYFGRNIYNSSETNFTLLLDAVKSIDGNHQWQAFALPYPKKGGISENAIKPSYGYNYFSDPSKAKGFRLWVDPYLRERVFFKLFPYSASGSLSATAELKDPLYTHEECPQNPFPLTQDAEGKLVNRDVSCRTFASPDISAFILPFKDIIEYEKKYYNCDGFNSDIYYTSVASFGRKKKAEALKNKLTDRYPDIKIILVKRGSIFKRWRVILSDCITEKDALEIKDLAIRRRLTKTPKIHHLKVKKSTSK